MANLTHFVIAGLALIKGILANPSLSYVIWSIAIIYSIFAIFFETITILNILNESMSIIYAGTLSGGIAFTLQIYAQKNISPAPSAIIFSLEGVFATIAAWIILDQVLGINNLIGCAFILIGVIFSQLLPIYESKTKSI